MNRDEAIAAGQNAIQQSLNQAIGVAFDAGAASVPASSGGQFAQSDIDAAVAKVTADDQSHMADLQKQIDLDQSGLTSLKASMKEALAQALSILSPGPDSTATQQVPGVSAAAAASKPADPAVAVQSAGPLPDQNSGTNSAPAVTGNGAGAADVPANTVLPASVPPSAPDAQKV